MKFNFRKISAVTSSLILAGATLGLAAAANYPAPFVAGGSANVAVVYGTGSGVSALDVVQAGNIQSNLQSYMGSDGNVNPTDSASQKTLATSSRKLYYGDAINAPISSLSATELPTMLKDGTFTDLSGTQYDYTQTVTVGATQSTFGTSGGDYDDPTLYLDVGTDPSAGLYNYTLSFTKNLNVSDATNVQGQKLNIMGVDYIIGASSTNSTLYLYGSGETVTVAGDASQTVTVAGTDHTVQLITTSDSTHARISVDGVTKDVVEGSSYAFSGDINVYVKSIVNPQFAGDLRQAELIVGANTLKLVDGQTVKEGADETSIKGTLTSITGAGTAGEISAIKVSVAMPKSSEDSLVVGDSFTDPVFGGLKVTFAAANPALDSSSRGMIVADTDNNQFAYVTFTSARAATAGEQKLAYTYDNNTASTAVSPVLAHQVVSSANKGLIHVKEGENAKEGDWIVVNQGDAGTILEVDDISIDTTTSGTVTFTDAITGDSQTVTLTNSTTSSIYNKSGVNFFGGTGYTVSADGTGTYVNITWGSSTTTLFPRIKLADGGWIAFLTQTNVANATDVILPDGVTTLTTTGTSADADSSALVSPTNGLNWNITGNYSTSAGQTTVYGVQSGSMYCNFNATYGPAILFLEPKKWDDSSAGDAICIPMTTAGTTEIAVGTPQLSGTNSGFTTLTSDTYESQAIDKYGSLVTMESRTNENGKATIAYPSSQMYLDVVVSEQGAAVSTNTGSSSTQLGNVLVKDSEVSSVSSKNLIIVGGSCINSAAATVLGGAYCGASFTEQTGVGSGQFLIQGFDGAFSSGKLALVVAGYDAADTVNAATYLMNKPVDTMKKYLGTSSTEATLQTTTA